MISDFIAGLIGGEIGATLSGNHEKRRARKRHECYQRGEPVVLAAAYREVNSETTWLHGNLAVDGDRAVWSPLGTTEKSVHLAPNGLHVERIRSVYTSESWSINPRGMVLVGRVNGRDVEVLVTREDVSIVSELFHLDPAQAKPFR